MNDFITDLFNIDRKKIKKMNVVTSKDKTEFHIVLNLSLIHISICFAHISYDENYAFGRAFLLIEGSPWQNRQV